MAETKIEKNIKTRIKLKYGSYTELVTENPRLLDGEIAIACLTTAAATKPGETDTQHPVLFKIGGDKYPAGHAEANQFKKFNDLPWASALAADVYEWAKKNGVHVTGNGNAITAVDIDDEGYLAFTKGETFATKDELEELRGGLEADTNTTYEFEIPAVGAENAGKLVIYKKEIGGARALDKVLDIATPEELTNAVSAITPESLGLSSVMHFIGAYPSAPTKAFAGTNKERDLKDGDLYLNTLENKEYVRSNGVWVELGYPTDHSTELGLKLNANGWVDNTSKNGWIYDDKGGGETIIAPQSIKLGVDYFNRMFELTPSQLSLDNFTGNIGVSLSPTSLEFYSQDDSQKYAYEGARFTVQPDADTIYTINLPEASGELVVAESNDVVYIIDGNF